jgi:heptosyltransferase-1
LKILIVKLSSLGDVVHAMPAVQDILRALPDAQIDWVVERGFAPLAQRCRGVHRVIASDMRRWRKAPFSAETRSAWRAFRLDLQQDAYDAVIDLQGLTKSALVAWLARLSPAGQRYGLANQTEGSSFEAPARWVAHRAITLPAHSHAVTRSRELCAQALHYRVPNELVFGLVAQQAQVFRASAGMASASGLRGTVALVHGTSRANAPAAQQRRIWRGLATRQPGRAANRPRHCPGFGARAGVAELETRRAHRRAGHLQRGDWRRQRPEPYRRGARPAPCADLQL